MTALIFLLAFFGLQEDDSHNHGPMDFKTVVAKVVLAGREKFRPLEGYRVEMHPSRESWFEARDPLPGAEWCRIFEYPQMTYACQFTGTVKFEELVAKTTEALGDDYNLTKRPKSATFAAEPAKRKGTVTLQSTGPTAKPVIRITFRLPEVE